MIVPRLSREGEIKTAIVEVLKKRGQLGYNMLCEEVHGKAKCGRNQFSKYLKELQKEGVVSSKKSPTHGIGIILELGPDAGECVQAQHFKYVSQSMVSALLPFAEFRRTGSIEEQLAEYDLINLLPFRITIKLTSMAPEGRKIIVEGTVQRDGSISDNRIIAT